MSSPDWSRFVLKINIKAPVKAIYDAWTIPEQLEQWFVREASFNRSNDTPRETFLPVLKGDKYVWRWHGHPDEVIEKGEVLIANEVDKLQFSFTTGGIVTVDIGESMGETIVMLTQEKIPTDEKGRMNYFVGCYGGWTFYLANLKSYMEGGIDLRNRNISFSNMVNS